MTEEWRDIPGFEGYYQVSSLGHVRGLTRTRRDGRLVDGGLKSSVFRRNPQVNHRNGDKTDAAASNLEWCSSSENHLHAHRVLKRRVSHAPVKPVIGISDSGTVRFKSVGQAAVHGFDKGSIIKCAKGLRATHKGYSWSYDSQSGAI